MKIAQLHPLEQNRLAALRQTNLLDSLSEEEFDSITALASYICKTPIALISLVDEKRQWFKSKVGLSAQETSRDCAFCAHTILQSDVFIVENSADDERFKDNPLVLGEPRVIFYAGAPIFSPETNLPLGTLCVIDHQSRKLDQQQIQSLKSLSRQITILIEMKNKLRQIEEQNQKLEFHNTAVENMQEGMVIQDASGRIVDYNKSALKILNLTSDQILGKTSTDRDWQAIRKDGSVFPGDEHPSMIALKTGVTQTGVVMGIKAGDAKDRWISINANPIFINKSDTPSHAIMTFADITELQLAQKNLIENERLVSLAQMASGIAHEINNPLSVIHAVSSLASKIVDRKPINETELKAKLSKIDETVFRISKIVKGLRILSRDGSKEEAHDVKLADVLSDTLSICSERFRNHQIVLHVPTNDHFTVRANFTQLGQVLLNLLNNSFDAILKQNERWIKLETEILGNRIQIRVSDSGEKIPDQIIQKLFLPFYTTKGFGKGTGLGLSISKNLIEDMGGQLYYDSAFPNTSFVIELQMANSQKNQVAS